MKKQKYFLFLIVILLAACTGTIEPATSVPAASAPTASHTQAEPTATNSPEPTVITPPEPTATNTSVPTATPLPEPTSEATTEFVSEHAEAEMEVVSVAGQGPITRYGAAGGDLNGNLVVTHGFGTIRYDDPWLFNTASRQWENITLHGADLVRRPFCRARGSAGKGIYPQIRRETVHGLAGLDPPPRFIILTTFSV